MMEFKLIKSLCGLVQDTTGNFYGTTEGGGSFGDGTAFEISVGLGPFVEPRPFLGKVGGAITILGNNLSGATAVTFNGTSATMFTAKSSEIKVTVPAGATSGTAEVTTPTRVHKSNKAFVVIPRGRDCASRVVSAQSDSRANRCCSHPLVC
jgi:IPT/TIG domain